jgi:hypothetical protein
MLAKQLRRWIWVINNPDEAITSDDIKLIPNVRIATWQLEIGDSGTVHYQGYIEFTQGTRGQTLKNMALFERAHLEGAFGKRAANVSYCSKEEGRLEGPFYYPTKELCSASDAQGSRTDLTQLSKRIREGATNADLIDEMAPVALKYHKAIAWQRTYQRLAPDTMTKADTYAKDCVIYWGPTGTGKSHRLRHECGDLSEWFWCRPGKWFDGYDGQTGLVFDEFRDHWMPFGHLLALLDMTPRRNEIKGSMVLLTVRKYRFSSNIHPKNWYSGIKGTVTNRPWLSSPLRRRFSAIIKMSDPVVAPGVFDVVDEDEPSTEEEEYPLVQERHNRVDVLVHKKSRPRPRPRSKLFL